MEYSKEPDEDCEFGRFEDCRGENRRNEDCKHEPTQCPGWVVHARRVQSISEQSRGCAVLSFTALLLILCLASFAYCQECLFGILIISACLCPFFHPLNAPLWLAIVLLTIGGWTFTTGALSISWKSSGVH